MLGAKPTQEIQIPLGQLTLGGTTIGSFILAALPFRNPGCSGPQFMYC